MESANPLQPLTPFSSELSLEVNPFDIGPHLPDGTGRGVPASFDGTTFLLDPVPENNDSETGDRMFAGQLQYAIAPPPQIGPPLPGQPPSPPADPIVGATFVVNQEAVDFTTDGNNASADGTPGWHLRSDVRPEADANITKVWDQDVLGRNVVIGIIDNGFEIEDPEKDLLAHPHLETNYRADLSYDFDEGDEGDEGDKGDKYPSRILNSLLHWDEPMEWKKRIKGGQGKLHEINGPSGLINELKINWNITHENISDLSVTLKGPNDNELELSEIKNDYSVDITEKYKGKSANGSWKLVIKDNTTDENKRGEKTGTLDSFSLEFETITLHGTAVAGVAAASEKDGINIRGVAPEAEWAGLRMGADGTDDDEIAWALSHENDEIDIYNNSWGTPFLRRFPKAEEALENAVKEGRGGLGNIYVFSGGNAAQDELGNPHSNVNYNDLANSRHTIAVAAIGEDGKQAVYSEPGAPLLVSAYSSSGIEGDRAISTTGPYRHDDNDSNDYIHEFGGTSASAPIVSGVIALMLEVNPQLTSRDVQHILVETAQKNDPDDDDEWSENGAGYHVNHKYGFGAIDAEAAVELARNWTSVGEEISVSRRPLDTGFPIEIPNHNPDDPLTSTITINREDDMTIEWVEVEFNAKHHYLSQLEIVLISPNGTRSVLAEKHGNGINTLDDDFYDWTFTSARHWGESPVGEWTLLVSDKDGRNPRKNNTWHSWKLNIYGTQPTVSLEATDPDASEDGDSGQLTFTRTGNTTHPLTVNYSASGTATAGSDYSTIGNIVIIPAGSSEETVPIAPIDDNEVEEEETLVVNLEAGTGYKLGDESSASVSIADNDRQDSLADLQITNISNPTTVAPRGALTYSLFVVNSGSAAANDIEISNTLPVEFSLLNVNSGGNFVADTSTPGIVSFTDGSLISGEFAILTISGNVSPDAVGSITNSVVVDPNNQIPETDEDNNTAIATTTITSLPEVTISATDADASEDGDAGEFTVARSGDTTESLSVSFSTAGDATEGSDYATIGAIVIPAGSSEVTVSLDPIDDDEVEEEETLVVNLEAGTGYKLGDESSASVSIADNDVGPLVMEVGRPDNFDQTDGQEGENPLTTEPGEPRPFDGNGLNQSFTHRFDLSEALAAGEIISATFETKIKRIAGANDTIEFGNFSDPENLPAWGSYIGKGGVATTWLDDGWTTGEAIEFNFDMSALSAFDVNTDAPTRSRNLLPMMNNLGFLDVTIEDDSMVDYVRLTVEVAPTEGPLPYVVTNTNDSGAGSLRSAIAWANDNPGRDTILFDIPGDGPHTIAPASALPDITEAVVIDGWSQNGGTPPATPLIVLDGSNAGIDLRGNFRDGLKITGSNVEVRGLVINKWGYGIRITGDGATDNWIYGNFIGTNDGTSDARNARSGVLISEDAGNNIIGTNGDGIADTAEANLISGSYRFGIVINSDSNIVAGNRIGTNQDGSAGISNRDGVFVSGDNNIIGTNGDGIADAAEANLISGSGMMGVFISGKFNAVAGNLIGTNLEGNAAIGNSSGVQVSGDHNIIGTNSDGTADAIEGNLISGNGENGVQINGDFNVVAGNRIGTNLEGNAALSNSLSGVQVSGNNNIIGTNGDGTADADETNLISGNSWNGVYIIGGNSNIVAGNNIGTNLDGTGAIANGIAGVAISGDNNRIGGSNTVEGNIIAFNGYDGVEIFRGTGNRIQGNAIFSNTGLGNSRGLGIELNYDGVTANDAGDSDTGANNLQNFPELTSATSDTATTTIQGTLNSTGNTTFTLEFFANSTLDESGYGEGETFLGSQEVTTDSNGNASFTANFSTSVPVGQFITATATDSDGNTSEFSQGKAVSELLAEYSDLSNTNTVIDFDNVRSAPGVSFSSSDRHSVSEGRADEDFPELVGGKGLLAGDLGHKPITITFDSPVSEVGLGWYHAKSPSNIFQVFDRNGVLLGEVTPSPLAPSDEPGKHWAGFVGIKRANNDIAKAVVLPDPEDWYVIDNVSFGRLGNN
ncbi:MAG: S8 family serine peptidase [Hormoscilla sp.]